MDRFVLLGTYCTRDNVEVVKMSDEIENLKRTETAISKVNHYMRNRDRDEPCPKTLAIIERDLFNIDIVDQETDWVHEIDCIGIFEIKDVEGHTNPLS